MRRTEAAREQDPKKPQGCDPVEVTLKKPHTHAGREYAAGDPITVEARQIPFLVSQKVIDEPSTAEG